MPWAAKIANILAKPYPPTVDPNPDQKPQWVKFGNWALICEDVLDTEVDPRFVRMCYDELKRRGLDDTMIQEMHRVAWLTVGWLNYERMLWEWVHLDQDDVEHAIDWLHKDQLISKNEHNELMAFVTKWGGEPTDAAAASLGQ